MQYSHSFIVAVCIGHLSKGVRKDPRRGSEKHHGAYTKFTSASKGMHERVVGCKAGRQNLVLAANVWSLAMHRF
jgi:hypothetical protein